MKIKSLILGSATVALATTGVQAADAIVIAEPEPVEYVRVCDVYGAGYFYIPGTETCLKISGWVRHQVDTRFAGNLKESWTVDGVTERDTNRFGRVRERGFHQLTGAQINLDARSETEYGTLRGWVQLEGTASDRNQAADQQDIPIFINRAVLQLGGLYMGYADSLFSSSSNINGSGLGNAVGFTNADTFDYHYEQRHQIGYQFSGGNGFWGAIGIEHDDTAESIKISHNHTPDVVGKIAYEQAWGGVWLAAGYDESANGAGVRGGVQANFSPFTIRLDGYYRSNADVSYGPTINITGPWQTGDVTGATRWGLQATALYQINPKLGIAAGVGYYDDIVARGSTVYDWANHGGVGPLLTGITPDDTRQFVGGHAWTANIGLNWQPVQNFVIGTDFVYRKAHLSVSDFDGNTYKAKADAASFRLRFQRNF